MTMPPSADQRAPVIVMRWFPGGSGYAYPEDLDPDLLVEVGKALKPAFSQPNGHRLRAELPGGRWLLALKEAELHCLDANAAARHPYVLRALVLDRPLRPQQEEKLCRQLSTTPLPEVGGPHAPGLHLSLPRPYRVPAIPQWPSAWLRNRLPWVLAALLLTFEAIVPLWPEPEQWTLAWSGRLLLVLTALLAYFVFTPPVLTQEELEALEGRCAGTGDTPLPLPLRQWLGDGVGVVLPDGRLLSGEDLETVRGRAPTPGPGGVRDTEYLAIEAGPGLALVRGRERLTTTPGQDEPVLFTRSYAWARGRWRLRSVQWTATIRTPAQSTSNPALSWGRPRQQPAARVNVRANGPGWNRDPQEQAP